MASFRTEMRGEVAVVTFDLPGEPVNTLSPAVGAEFAEELERLGRDEAVRPSSSPRRSRTSSSVRT